MPENEPYGNRWSWRVEIPLPAGTPDDPYDPDDLAEALRELAERVAEHADPLTGEVWDRSGRLLGNADLIDGNGAGNSRVAGPESF